VPSACLPLTTFFLSTALVRTVFTAVNFIWSQFTISVLVKFLQRGDGIYDFARGNHMIAVSVNGSQHGIVSAGTVLARRTTTWRLGHDSQSSGQRGHTKHANRSFHESLPLIPVRFDAPLKCGHTMENAIAPMRYSLNSEIISF
jgi:hypothetical protein